MRINHTPCWRELKLNIMRLVTWQRFNLIILHAFFVLLCSAFLGDWFGQLSKCNQKLFQFNPNRLCSAIRFQLELFNA